MGVAVASSFFPLGPFGEALWLGGWGERGRVGLGGVLGGKGVVSLHGVKDLINFLHVPLGCLEDPSKWKHV